ncbi:MAG: N-acetylneuraminate synthase [Candidatus Omnitrophica bacterium]|nr:N-acetylneuraminate synthase [Candidatus Omnitrophota bacterium]MCM8790619.1 N-acetylneuraminate synthase [Candidatus Omnitrophota bacterium]
MSKIFIVAEIGVNHNGSVRTAKTLIDVARDAGCDAVKFQSFRADSLATRSASKARYQKKNLPESGTQLAMLKRLELSWHDQKELYLYCRRRGIIFMSSPFDESSADFLDSLGMKIFKVPSGEITNEPLVRHIARKGKPIILSTGMSYLSEVGEAVGWIRGERRRNNAGDDLVLLHCVSSYPTRMGDVNLLAMKTMASEFGLPIGLSDHTLGIEVPIAAVAMGACVIEKHITLSRFMKGPDHRASIEPDELKKMVMAIRNIERAMGDGVKRPVRSELDTRLTMRRSLVAARDIKVGEMINGRDICAKRAGNGMGIERLREIVGVRAVKNIQKDGLLKPEYFEKVSDR